MPSGHARISDRPAPITTRSIGSRVLSKKRESRASVCAGTKCLELRSMTTRTLLFTDVVDSTRLVERLGDARCRRDLGRRTTAAPRDFSRAIAAARSTAPTASSCCSTNRPMPLRYALGYHATLADLGLSARVGIHVGPVTLRENTPEDIARGAKPIEVEGLAKPLAARIMALAGGGQTLLSAAAREALADALPDGTTIERHGHYRLKGIEEPVEIFELGVRGASPSRRRRMSTRRTASSARRPLAPGARGPPQPSRRARRLRRQDRGAARARRTARRRSPAAHGSRSGRHRQDAFRPPLRLDLARRLAGRRLLLRSVRRHEPRRHSSSGRRRARRPAGQGRSRRAARPRHRRPRTLPGHPRQLRAGRASTPPARSVAGSTGPPRRASSSPAASGCTCRARRSSHRAAAAGNGCDRPLRRPRPRAASRTSSSATAIAPPWPRSCDCSTVCRSPSSWRPRGCGCFPRRNSSRGCATASSCSPASRGAAARQATLRAAIDWSWDLLAPWEQAAFAQCSVFEGGFTLEAAEAVLDLSPWPEAPLAMDAVQALVDKSLLRTWVPAEQGRYDIEEPYFGMYISIHEYAAEKLAGERARRGTGLRGAARPATSPASVRRTRSKRSSRHGGVQRRRALALELDNLVAACRRAAGRGDGEVAVAAYRAAWEVLELQGPFALGVALGAQVLALPGARCVAGAAAAADPRARRCGAPVASRRPRTRLTQACALSPWRRATGAAKSRVLSSLGNLHREQGRMTEARGLLEAALGYRCARWATAASRASSCASLGILHREQGRIDAGAGALRGRARHRTARWATVAKRASSSAVSAFCAPSRAGWNRRGSTSRPRSRIAREVGDRGLEGVVLANLGQLDERAGSPG